MLFSALKNAPRISSLFSVRPFVADERGTGCPAEEEYSSLVMSLILLSSNKVFGGASIRLQLAFLLSADISKQHLERITYADFVYWNGVFDDGDSPACCRQVERDAP